MCRNPQVGVVLLVVIDRPYGMNTGGRNLDGPVRRGGVVGQVQRHPHAGCAGRGASRRRRPAVGEHPRRVSLERASGTLSSHVVLRQQTACPALRRVGASSCWQAVFELSAAAKSFVVLAGPLSQASAASGLLYVTRGSLERVKGGMCRAQIGGPAADPARGLAVRSRQRADVGVATGAGCRGWWRCVLRQRKAERSMCRAPATMRADANISPTVAGLSAVVDGSSIELPRPTCRCLPQMRPFALQRVRPASVVVDRQSWRPSHVVDPGLASLYPENPLAR